MSVAFLHRPMWANAHPYGGSGYRVRVIGYDSKADYPWIALTEEGEIVYFASKSLRFDDGKIADFGDVPEQAAY